MAHHTQKNRLEIFIPDLLPSTAMAHRITAIGNVQKPLSASVTCSRCHLPGAGIPLGYRCISHKLGAQLSQYTA